MHKFGHVSFLVGRDVCKRAGVWESVNVPDVAQLMHSPQLVSFQIDYGKC